MIDIPTMSRVVLYIAASLDGFIARRDDDISWLTRYEGGAEDYGYRDLMRRVDILIMGARTYEQVLKFESWPYEDKKTYVVTNRELPRAPGADLVFYSGNLINLLSDLKALTSKDIWLVGGGRLVGAFMDEGLIDELMLFVVPILLASGIPLFAGLNRERELTPAEFKRYDSGIVMLRYLIGRPDPLEKQSL